MTSPASPVGTGRADWLDLFKSLLVYGMIGAHVVQLLAFRPRPIAAGYSDFINLITFSGFMFAFGLGIGLPKPERTRSLFQRLRPVLLLLLAAWISAFAFVVLVDRTPLTPGLLLDLFSFRRLFGWSEFLASFFVLYLVIAVARPLLLGIGKSWYLLLAAIILCLLSTLIVVPFDFPLIATIVGTRNFASFPLLAYLPWFLVGIWLGDRLPNLWQAALAIAATAGFYWWTMRYLAFPERFPPSALFVVGSAGFLLTYLALAHLIARNRRVPLVLLLPGRHVLGFLLISNLAIFTLRRVFNRFARNVDWIEISTALAIIIVLTLGWWLVDTLRRRARRSDAAGAARM